ncbi:hypothetical protein [Gordonia malaquae]|uniref:hypothetical protein n=1 Tax=Gordonia malaquae TaxID=410332 RepID=UPI00301A5B02
MTAFNKAHGDTAAVRMNLTSNEPLYREYMKRVGVATWDEDDHEWTGVETAAQQLKQYVQEIQTLGRATDPRGDLGEISDAALDEVDWYTLIVDELVQRNLDDGRDESAGLPADGK